MLLRDLGEWELLRRLSAYAPPGQFDDDAALLNEQSGRQLVVNTDVLVEGVHFPKGIPASAITNQESAQQIVWGNPETTGGGSVNISKYTSKDDNGYTTITVKSLDTGLTIANAMATISGGQHGAVQIMSTKISNDGMTYTVKLKFPGEEGTVGTLNLKWYTLQLAL